MKNIIKKYKEKYGYEPSLLEIKNLYTQGFLVLSDKEENLLLIEFEKLY